VKQFLFVLCFVWLCAAAKAQKIDSLFFNLYTDSLKKGSWNYINVDAKLSNGKYMPLTAEQLDFKISAGKLERNTIWLDWTFPYDSIIVEVSLKKEPAVRKSITIWVKKKDDQLDAPVNDSLLQQINNRPKSSNKKKGKG
jgi:hypothetical protein